MECHQGLSVGSTSSRSVGGDASTHATTRVRVTVLSLSIAALALLSWVAAVPASAAGGPEFLVQFGETGAGAGQLNNPRGIASDPKTGHVYVVESNNRRVSEFTPWGKFVKAFGWDVAPGAVNEQQEVRVRAAHGQFRLTFGAGGPGVSETGDLKFNATAAEVETALNALTDISTGGGTVTVTANPGNPDGATPYVYIVTFKGSFAGTNVTTQLSAVNGTEPLSGGIPSTTLEASTLANGTPGGTGLEDCTTESGCKIGTNGSGIGQLNNPLGVAIDANRDVYVIDFSNRRVQKYNSAGEFLLMFGGGVDKGGGTPANPGNVCTAAYVANGDNCTGAASTGSGPGQFGAWKLGSFIAVGPSDTVYVGDNNRIEQFNPDGTFESEIALPGAGFVESLAVDPSGNLYVANEQTKVPGIRRLSPSGTVLNTITTAVNGEGEPVTIVPKALATDSSGNLYVVDDQQPASILPEVFKFNPGGEQKASFGEGEFTASTGIGANPINDVYVTNFTPTNSYVRAYGPLPTTYGPPPSVPPTINAEYASSVGTTSAEVKAEINPHFFPTTYYVQYGTGSCETGPCAEEPTPPGTGLGGERDTIYPTRGVLLAGLTPGATYHYRFVAVSEAGTVFGPDRTFKTYLAGAFALPDGRAFEMVSPPDKNSAEVAVPGNAAGGLVDPGYSVKPLQAALGGEAMTYASFTAFAGPHGAPAASQYLSRRSAAGWFTENITPPDQEGYTRDPLRGFSPDLSVGAVIQSEPTLAPGAVAGYENLYLRENESGSLRALTTVTPRVSGLENYCVHYAGASANSDRVIFWANGALTPEAPEAPGVSLYEWFAGELKLVSVLPDATAAQPSRDTGFGAGSNGCRFPNENIVRNAISADGSRIFWTYRPSGMETQLFARLNGTETIQLDRLQGGSGPAGGGRFWAASDDGSSVFFTDPNKLTVDASAGDLYRYDLDAEALTDLTGDHAGPGGAEVLGVLGASEDGSYVYFVAKGALDTGATAGQPNLYVWHSGEAPHFIATLVGADSSDWDRQPGNQTARVTPDGRHLAFLSAANRAGYDNLDLGTGEPDSEVYLYDTQSGELVCASCNPSGARPAGPASLPVWNTPYEQPRYFSDDGGYLFFESLDTLALQDTNGKQDVYEFEREGVGQCTAGSEAFSASSGGCLHLISTGKGGDESYFLDASSDGRDVFVASRQRLVPADEDERFDVYDARIGGGFPPPPAPPAICAGEACRPAQAAPQVVSPASAGFVGEGNVKGERKPCPKGKHRVRRHGRTRCVKKARGRHRVHNHRRAGR